MDKGKGKAALKGEGSTALIFLTEEIREGRRPKDSGGGDGVCVKKGRGL